MSFFITFEGVEGSGKSTQLQLLRDRLLASGQRVVVTREPGGCPIADAIREILLAPENRAMTPRTELLLYNAARVQHIEEIIRPALEAKRVVLCDRFIDATTVYQGAGRGLPASRLTDMIDYATDGLTPDLTLLLDLPAEIGLGRAQTRNRDGKLLHEGRFELEDITFHQRIRQGYLELAQQNPRFHVINANDTEENIAMQIRTIVEEFLTNRSRRA